MTKQRRWNVNAGQPARSAGSGVRPAADAILYVVPGNAGGQKGVGALMAGEGQRAGAVSSSPFYVTPDNAGRRKGGRGR